MAYGISCHCSMLQSMHTPPGLGVPMYAKKKMQSVRRPWCSRNFTVCSSRVHHALRRRHPHRTEFELGDFAEGI